eukprot:maker-scaffold_6-snap-gene-12.4-mRNA-1 protein AED:0.00 eAED:0.00 QI:241/1/1/1/1/1/2/135/525
MAQAVRIIDIDSTGNSFDLDERALGKIFSSVPEDMPISIVSVVGGFRTGKSFLLDFFLHYLTKAEDNYDSSSLKSWLQLNEKIDGNVDTRNYSPQKGFGWKHGSERCTTGIWLWNKFFILPVFNRQKKVTEPTAIFLMDTQGMFDRKTNQHLTASIFGMSTLISSTTIYNLVMDIREDHLQHLALFSEYARIALVEEKKGKGKGKKQPFQRLEFLVRDFRSLDVEDENVDFDSLHEQFDTYLKDVMSADGHKDLQEVRKQISICFEEIGCYCLPHPGTSVTEKRKKFDGKVKGLDDLFRVLLEDFVYRVFHYKLEQKEILNEKATAGQLFEHIKAYCKLFQESEIFPEAKTLLRATQEANIAYGINKAERAYQEEMDKVAGVGASYIEPELLLEHHAKALRAATLVFKSMVKIGSGGVNELNKEGEESLKSRILERFSTYKEANRLRDPLAFISQYSVPLLIALIAYVANWILGRVCSRRSFACLDVMDFFGSLSTIIWSFLAFHLLSTLYKARQKFGSPFISIK